jgi:hypothetical protein
MSKPDWRKIAATVAPALATALGGPLAGIAVSEMSRAVLGKDDGDEAEVGVAIATGGADALLKLKGAEAEFKLKMEELGLESDRLAYADTASAREREVKSGDTITVQILAAIIVGSFLAIVYKVLFSGSQVDSVIAGTLIGYVSAKADTVVGYYFGSSRGSSDKTKAFERMFNRKKGDA